MLPPYLKPGDKVGVVSTSNFTKPEYIDALVKILKEWQLKPVLGKTIGPKHGSFAGSDRLRRDDLQEMIDKEDICAIFETMGGYGIVRIIDQVNFNRFKDKPKWVVGYSDTTFLHSYLQGMLSTGTIHGTMAADLENGYHPTSWDSLRKALFGEKLEYQIKPHPLNRNGEAFGSLVGGNISILCNAKGTKTEANTNGKILFLEETGEHKFRLDSYLTSLKAAGKFEYLKGLLVGSLEDIKEDDPPFGRTPEEIIWDAVKDYDFPVCFGFPAGHGKINKALIFGRHAALKITPEGATLKFED